MIKLRPYFLLAVLVALCFQETQAQRLFTLNGRLKIEGGGLENASVVIYKDGQKERTLTSGLSKFNVELEYNTNYVLSFEKDGYVAKKLVFNTNAPAEAIANGFAPFEFAVSLFKQYDDVNIVVFNQPVGIIRYEANVDDFDYDTDYTKSIQSQLEEVQENIEEKQKEEAKNSKEEEKLAQQQAKEEAKREAEEQRMAEAMAREEEKRMEEAKKAEEARKAEQARLEEEARKAKEAVVVEEAPKETGPVVVVEAPPPPPPPAPVQRDYMRTPAVEGSDPRRSITAVEGNETSPVHPAPPMALEETKPEIEVMHTDVVRKEELIVETNKVVTVIRLEAGAAQTEYRRIAHKWGGVFYFKDGNACSQQIYENEALADQRD